MGDEVKAGDVVMIKSGGPNMTVGMVRRGVCWCFWYAGGISYATDKIPATLLRKVAT